MKIPPKFILFFINKSKCANFDSTGHRWLAALSSYNFKLKYKSGRSKGDTDGLSRRPQETMFPDIVQLFVRHIL